MGLMIRAKRKKKQAEQRKKAEEAGGSSKLKDLFKKAAAQPKPSDGGDKREGLNEFGANPVMGEFLCIGDYISLYCEETEGYVYSEQSSSTDNGLCIYTHQDRNRPSNIPNQHVVVFQVCIQNRYKLNKKYRKNLAALQNEHGEIKPSSHVRQSKAAAHAEDNDNQLEQKRQHGKRVRYGELVQLKHHLTGKFVHMSTTQTSQIDKNYMKVSLHDFNAKNAQFRILPRYKVKSEGEVVQLYDQIVFESVKSPGHYFHASESHQLDYKSYGSELNLGVDRSSFTLIGAFRETLEQERFVRGGSVIRLFHKELEAYLVAEGLFDEGVTEDVHFRIRVIDQHRPKSLSPSTSGITYWQIEAEHSILDGDVLRWEQQIRLRSMLTRQYLCIDSRSEVSLITDPSDPRSVFRLHSVLKELDEIQYESYARIEHVLTGCWLHALKDEDYEKREFRTNDQEETSMYGLRWDGASVRKVSASGESMYDDAYTLQMVEKPDVMNFNFVAGMVPFLFNLIHDFQGESSVLTAKKTHSIIAVLRELKSFMTVEGLPNKDRQKLMRNLRVIDLLVRLLQCPLKDGDEEPHMIRIFKEAYDVLHAYMIGKSRKNALYFAKYIDFFQTQFTQKGGIGLNVAQMIVELIRDKRKIVDRITNNHLDIYIDLLRRHQNYRFLDLLQVLCVCDGVSIPNNQSYITEKWLRSYKDSVYLTDRGQNINKRPNIVYISTNNTESWVPLHDFVNPDGLDFNGEKYDFLIHQLDLFKALTYGRNDFAIHVITREFGYLTWEDAFLCLTADLLPDSIRAKYCELIIGLFVDVGNNYSVLDNPNICFVYEYVGSKDSEREQSQFVVKDLVTIFPVLRDWLTEFLNENCTMTASDIGHNQLIEQVLRLLQHLVKFGYYSDLDDVRHLLTPLLGQLDGRHDIPFEKDKSKGYSKEAQKAVNKYRESGRFETSKETEAIVRAKFQAMEVLDLLLTFQRNIRLKTFVEKCKIAEQGDFKKRKQNTMEPLLYETFKSHETTKKALKKQKEVLKELKDMFHASAIFDIDSTTNVLMDLSNYKYDIMVMKSLDILNKLYSSQSDMFRLAIEAQILLSQDSARVHREVQRSLPVLRRLAKQKLNDQQVLLMSEILDELAEFCHLPKHPHEPHFMNQNIMISHGILDIVLDILSQEIDAKLLEQYSGMKVIFQKTLFLLQLLIRENDNVQTRIFNSLDTLLDVQIVPSDLALALKEVFIANQANCLKVHPQQIKKIVRLAAENQNNAYEFLDLLNVLVKVEGLDLTIKRNQALVMKYIMQNFKKSAYVLDQNRESREHILTNQAEPGHLAYFAHLVDLLATCAEGENKFIESLCQTILPIEEILWVINHRDIDCNIKRPFIKFMMWVYMKPVENLVESGAADLQHHKQLWNFIETVVGEINQLSEYVKATKERTFELLKLSPSKSAVNKDSDMSSQVHSGTYYILEGVMPFLEVFYTSFFSADKDLYPDEIFFTDSLATALVAFCDASGPLLTNPAHMKSLVTSLTAVVTASGTPKSILVSVLEKFTVEMKVGDTKSAVRKGNMEYYAAELELNAKFHMFAQNCRQVHVGHNTVQQQLKHGTKKSKREYTEIGSNEEVPLGEEFQNLVKCFIVNNEKKTNKKYALTVKLLDQLAISAKSIRVAVTSGRSREELDVKCLQILRTLIHNEERRLPDDWDTHASDTAVKKQLTHIREIQTTINSFDVVNKVLPHLARRSDAIAREVLAFVSIMLFNANREVQKSLLDYFFSTREEVFFMAVRDRMQMSTNSIKEKRALLTQHEMRRAEFMNNFGSFQTSLVLGRSALQKIQHYELRLKKEKMQGWRALSRAIEPVIEKNKKKPKKKKVAPTKSVSNGLSKDFISDRSNENLLDPGTPDKFLIEYKPTTGEIELADVAIEEEETPEQMFAEMDESVGDMLQYKDDGCIELVLKVLARICDGQHVGLQNYLREQPDNVKSFNIIGETAQFLNVVYSSINRRTVDLVIQLFSTLNEFCSGNQENREVIYNKKAIDYINFIIRAGDIADCSPEKVLELREAIGSLIMSLIEENGPAASQVAKEVKDTLDKEAVYRIMAQCYEMHQQEKPKLEDIVKPEDGVMKSAKSLASLGGSLLQGVMGGPNNALKDSLITVGFSTYLILARMNDIDPHMTQRLNITPEQMKAYDYYKKNSTSVEVVKDDVLQKVNFRVKNKILIREEVKERLKWNVDRTSPSNKIRDLMDWTRDIMQDISYQRKILFNPIAIMFTKGWLVWNYFVIFLSFAINALMLFTWNAKATIEDYERITALGNKTNQTFDWALLRDPRPEISRIPLHEYTITMYVLCGLHNLFSLFVIISYFLSNHPRLPTCAEITEPFRNCRNKDKGDLNGVRSSEEKPSKLDVKFFSFNTFFYMLFLAMSVTGTWYHGYFFAFHLLNIVNNNQLLSGVIKAVTLNGVSLLWVAILGFIVIYIYSLVGFSLLRAYFAPGDYLYCSTLWQCTVTVIRYGLIGDMFDVVKQSEQERTFETFWPIVLYHVSFFILITTIGLNIIFGIIVDTFSELRDLKWRAESDMKDTCFICSRNSYDFEHSGKGFDYHVRNEHNMWSYVFFFIHLHDMKTSDYTAVELFVSKLLDQENHDFFPMNRALCLSSVDTDSTESKIDDLLRQVTSIAQKQRDDEAEKKRKVEKLKQKRWQEKHRRFIFGIHHAPDEHDLSERQPLIPPPSSSNDGVYPPPPTSGHMMSVSDDSEYYKERKGSLTLLQILEGLPDDKSSPASRASSKSRILSIDSDDDSDDSDSPGNVSPVTESYDLIKSRETSRDRTDTLTEEPVVGVSVTPATESSAEPSHEERSPTHDAQPPLPHDDPTPDIDAPSPPHRDLPSPSTHEGHSPTHEDVTPATPYDILQPRDDILQPRDDILQPRDDILQPRDDILQPHDDMLIPRDDILQPRDDILIPIDDQPMPPPREPPTVDDFQPTHVEHHSEESPLLPRAPFAEEEDDDDDDERHSTQL